MTCIQTSGHVIYYIQSSKHRSYTFFKTHVYIFNTHVIYTNFKTCLYKIKDMSKAANEGVLRNRCSRGVLALENRGVLGEIQR